MKRLDKRKKGFTLLELIIVIVIIGILASLAVPRYFDAIENARAAEAKGTLAEIYKIEQAYYSINSAYMPEGTVSNGATIGVNLDNSVDGSQEISMVVPTSDNFTYTSTAGDDAEIIATGKGNTKYTWKMSLKTGQITSELVAGGGGEGEEGED